MDSHINFYVQSVAMLFLGEKIDMWLERVETYQQSLEVITNIHLCSCTNSINSSFKVGFRMESENTSVRSLCCISKVRYSVSHFKQLFYPLMNL